MCNKTHWKTTALFNILRQRKAATFTVWEAGNMESIIKDELVEINQNSSWLIFSFFSWTDSLIKCWSSKLDYQISAL